MTKLRTDMTVGLRCRLAADHAGSRSFGASMYHGLQIVHELRKAIADGDVDDERK
jgi:hypothetical protein